METAAKPPPADDEQFSEEIDRLLARLLAPERPALARCLAAVLGVGEGRVEKAVADDPVEAPRALGLSLARDHARAPGELGEDEDDGGEAWERLEAYGALPGGWLDAATRRFTHPRIRTEPLSVRECDELRSEGAQLYEVSSYTRGASSGPLHDVRFRPALVAPARADDAVALASDARGVATAEQLAREVCARLAPWGLPANPPLVVWTVESAGHPFEWPDELDRSRRAVHGVISRALGHHAQWLGWAAVMSRAGHDPKEYVPRPSHTRRTDFTNAAAQDLTVARAWRAASLQGERVPSLPRGSPPCVGERFAELPDPFVPLLALWHTGYALRAVTREAAVLYAPSL